MLTCLLLSGAWPRCEPLHESALRPRLAVVVVVDQMIPEQLDRLDPYLTGGLARFAHQGRRRTAQLVYSGSVTAPGHATLSTGVPPSVHGIIGNDWYSSAARTGVKSVGDDQAHRVSTLAGGVEAAAGSSSPHNLRVPGLADWLREGDPLSKSCSISSKDRGAILLAGQHARLALWWDTSLAQFVSSDWYTKQLPPFVDDFNRGWARALLPEGGSWVWESSLPEDFDPLRAAPDDQPGESSYFPGGALFPHPSPPLALAPTAAELDKFADFAYESPLGDQFSIELARQALVALELGVDEHPDLLCLSLSACDTVGHRFGPTSREVTDVLVRADRLLGVLFDELDARLGKQGWIALLSADHGVLELPEILSASEPTARRLPWKEARSLEKALRAQISAAHGIEGLLSFDGLNLYLDRSALEAQHVQLAELRAALAAAAPKLAPWVARAFTCDQLLAAQAAPRPDPDPFLEAAANSYDAERSPDLVLQAQPFTLPFLPSGTTHGSVYAYDRQVPLVFLGANFEAGRLPELATTLDALPTLLHALELPVPKGLAGRVLP